MRVGRHVTGQGGAAQIATLPEDEAGLAPAIRAQGAVILDQCVACHALGGIYRMQNTLNQRPACFMQAPHGVLPFQTNSPTYAMTFPTKGHAMTRTPPDLTDRAALARNRARVTADRQTPFLHAIAQEELQFRLSMVNRSFNSPAIVTGLPQVWGNFLPDARVVPDDPVLDLQEGAHDLVLHVMGLHWASDPVGQLVQARRALRPDGLFLGVLFGGQTLSELRSALAQAESDLTGGLSARVAPMAEIRDLGALLQRAGLALPVADSVTQSVAYGTVQNLFADLRDMGERNALAARRRGLTTPALFRRTEEIYAAHFSDGAGRLQATYDLIFLTGWAPDASQPRPLRPGSARMSLADALGSVETALPDQVKIPDND